MATMNHSCEGCIEGLERAGMRRRLGIKDPCQDLAGEGPLPCSQCMCQDKMRLLHTVLASTERQPWTHRDG